MASLIREETSKAEGASCHGELREDIRGLPLVAIVGSPNVGKSVLFNALTGAYVTVSNYPGTTVDLSHGHSQFGETKVGVTDTPGMYRLLPITEEERVGRRVLLEEEPAVVIHVVDAKNLQRMLPMTLELIEAGFPVILDVNLLDEAERLGVGVDVAALADSLGIRVVGTALVHKRGLAELRDAIEATLEEGCESQPLRKIVRYHPVIESALSRIEELLGGRYRLSARMIGILLLQGDEEVIAQVRQREGTRADDLLRIVEDTRARFGRPLTYIITQQQREQAQEILDRVLTASKRRVSGFAEKLSEATMNPLTGVPILVLVLSLLYLFVGVLGAQTLVEFLEGTLFGSLVNPWVNRVVDSLIPWQVLRDLVAGEYGVITLGLRYAIALILPIVGTFFIAFSIIEDSGYLPRLAMLIDRVFKRIGLTGRAVIPMVLGFGCDTMATIVTRTLETRRERVLSTILLALAIPCSAQLGVMLALLSGRPALLVAWMAIVAAVFLLVGYLSAKVLPGERPTFYMELPPLRLPTLGNILVKTYTRMEWYLREVLPTFVLASVLIWFGNLTGLFDLLIRALEPLVRLIGLPDQTAVAFLFGFFRRDYGAAGLYDVRQAMTAVQLLIATTTMTIFIPCIAQFSVMVKERGWKTALGIVAFIFPFAFLVGGLIHWVATLLGVS